MEECLPNLVRVGVEDTIEAQEEDGSNDVLGENDSEKVDEMPLHVAAGHCAITTGVIRVPLFVYSDATTDKLLAASSLNQDPIGQHMYLEFEMKAWTLRGDETA
ncbi:hypothetical protein Pmar_PMAR018562 [Perkinsus marinus ATCC 50983]|uniref:Uncharacterized protein n=1 Tax=Perkinsus marinus (strain ATCC 50983 / TXsc) TaxID=423536 RepID=C5L060_PERM5|nr:hypothetical protein Pmar_PMAR018562 [Perkinsus marinus ATCC 50983]EER09918.1 hypothetical protein Pmar_PMAR018562 [Perkinsus marinus ATCC 50983]|eukprot:XP_002778123.1 hypothetical protein Pmar_PMAR018562 [Perkinsus marinus ATCC 50983]